MQGRLGMPKRILCGVDMGNAAAGLICMIAMDPLPTVMRVLLCIVKLMAYMDDIAAAMTLRGCLWLQLAINSY